MFNPSQEDVRRFFCGTFRKMQTREVLTPLEAMAAGWIEKHSEYHTTLSDLDTALQTSYGVEGGETNPFLHLSMHLSIAEQISIDQPPGIRAGFQTLAHKLQSEHEAHHEIMECLGEMLWKSQRSRLPPDGAAYVEAIKKRAGK